MRLRVSLRSFPVSRGWVPFMEVEVEVEVEVEMEMEAVVA
jgi:hypothetical protein